MFNTQNHCTALDLFDVEVSHLKMSSNPVVNDPRRNESVKLFVDFFNQVEVFLTIHDDIDGNKLFLAYFMYE